MKLNKVKIFTSIAKQSLQNLGEEGMLIVFTHRHTHIEAGFLKK